MARSGVSDRGGWGGGGGRISVSEIITPGAQRAWVIARVQTKCQRRGEGEGAGGEGGTAADTEIVSRRRNISYDTSRLDRAMDRCERIRLTSLIC